MSCTEQRQLALSCVKNRFERSCLMRDLVSVIIPVHNRPALLREAVASVLAQTYRPIEIIIVDDGSTDDTPAVADALAGQRPNEIRVIHQANGGPGLAREAGRTAAEGEFIQYLDSDDVLLPEKFALQVAGLRENPQCGVSYGFTRHRRADGRVDGNPWKQTGKRYETMFPSFLQSRWWDTPTPLYRANICAKAGPWTDLWLEEDWEYDCRIAALGVHLHYVPAYIAEVRVHGEGHLCRSDINTHVGLAHRARAHQLIYQHALRGGISVMTQEMQHFARQLFLLARQCGAAGLVPASHELFLLSKAASGPERARRLDFVIYEMVARIVGWDLAGRIACMTDILRKTPPVVR